MRAGACACGTFGFAVLNKNLQNPRDFDWFFIFGIYQASSSRRCGNAESRVLCGFPSSEGRDENAFAKLTLPPSERHFHSGTPVMSRILSNFHFPTALSTRICL